MRSRSGRCRSRFGRWPATSAAARSVVSASPVSRVEQVQLAQRQRQLDDVAGPDAMLRVDDRHDVLVRRADVEELLVAEILDDVGASLERGAVAADLTDLEMLRPEARDELLAGDVAGDAAQSLRGRHRPVAGPNEPGRVARRRRR